MNASASASASASADAVVVASVLVHGNEYGLLEVLRRVAAQQRRPDAVVVVDNASPVPVNIPVIDGLRVQVVRSDQNLGVGGGHNLGIRTALDSLHADCVWVLEHDTFPDTDCLASLLRMRANRVPGVVVADITRNNYERHWMSAERDGSATDRFTFNGPLLDRGVFELVGPINEQYFVGQEDWEYSGRVIAAGLSVTHCSSAVVLHANKGDGRFRRHVSPTRLYYSARNEEVARRPVSSRDRFLHVLLAVAKVGRELLTPGRGWTHAAARWWAYRDGRNGRMGQQVHRFMRPR